MLPLLFFLLLLAPFGWAELDGSVDCYNNRCFAVLKCTNGRARVYSFPSATCNELQMLVEIDTRSALRFDFRVIYNYNETELNIPEIVIMNGWGAKLTIYQGQEIDLNVTDRVQATREGQAVGAMSSYRFTIEVDPPMNLFQYFIDNRLCKYKIAGWKRAYDDCESIFKSFRKAVRCDPSYIINQCTLNGGNCSKLEFSEKDGSVAACAGRLWEYTPWDGTWRWVHGMVCKMGMWEIRRDNDLWRYIATNGTKLYCGERQEVCEDKGSDLSVWRREKKGMDENVVMFLLGLYCTFTSIVLIFLFVRLYRKMDGMRGPGRYRIMRPEDNPRDGPPPSSGGGGSSSGSSSESGSKKKSAAAKKGPKTPATSNRFEKSNKEAKDKALRTAVKVSYKKKKGDK